MMIMMMIVIVNDDDNQLSMMTPIKIKIIIKIAITIKFIKFTSREISRTR